MSQLGTAADSAAGNIDQQISFVTDYLKFTKECNENKITTSIYNKCKELLKENFVSAVNSKNVNLVVRMLKDYPNECKYETMYMALTKGQFAEEITKNKNASNIKAYFDFMEKVNAAMGWSTAK